MKKYQYFLFFILLCSVNYKLQAQDEVYDKPAVIIDTFDVNNNSGDKIESTKTKQEQKNALTELEKKKEKLNRIRLGLGNFGLQFGAITFIQATPTIGYMVIKNRLELGAGPVIIYQRIRYANNFVQSFFVYGSDIYVRGFVYKGINLEARYDAVNKPSNFDLDRRLWVHHLLLGAGYATPMGKIGVFNVSALYNVLNNDESIYRGTFSDRFPLIINMGFAFGLGGK